LLIAFAVGAMINAGTGAVGYMLLMTGYQKLSFLNSMVAVAVNIGLGIYLTPRYGAMGTAVSTGLAIVALNIMRLLQVRLLLKMHPYYAEDWKPLAAGLVASAVVGGITVISIPRRILVTPSSLFSFCSYRSFSVCTFS
jgi:O-antigen/teichoic acid export membrane protein